MDHDLYNIIGYLQENVFADCCANDSDSFNNLASELFILWLKELVEELDQELERLFEVRDKVLFRLFHSAG